MRDLHTTSDMRLLLLVCLLTWPGIASADETGFVTVAEGDDAVLSCSLSSKENIEQMIFDWKKDGDDQKQVFYYVKGSHYNNGRSGQDQQFTGRISHFQDELKFGNASIKIRNTELADNGSYTCIFPEKQKSHITLYVVPELKVRANIPGAARKPNAKPIHETEDWSLLQCDVQGVPEPTVEWKDSTGKTLPAKEPEIVERDHRFYITLQIVVYTTDNFTCVVTQEDIHHQINSTVAVHFPEKTGHVNWITGFVIGFAGVVSGIVGHIVWTRCKSKKGSSQDQHNTSRGGLDDQANSVRLMVKEADSQETS